MSITLPTKQYLDAAAGLLADGAKAVAVPIKGDSMRPFLKEGDTVYLSPIASPPKRGQIVLYRRTGGRYILHRIFSKNGGVYTMLGDAQLIPERGILSSQIIGCVSAADRRGRRITPSSPVWLFFTAEKFLTYPVHRALSAVRRGKNKHVK